jgi:type IV pilus biogenesis protein PilP
MPISKDSAKSVNIVAFIALAGFLAVAAAPASAQTPPVNIDLPPVEDGALPDSPVPSSASQMPDDTSQLPPDPCPMPSNELSRAPDDLAKVQADIDRYTLCMERAQLLQRLNDVALENQERLQQSNDVSADNPGMQLGSNIASFDDMRAQIMQDIGNQPVVEDTVEAPPAGEWSILKISGAAGGLAAQLGKSDGTLMQVRAGDTLPDGGQVNEVNATGVRITKDGERIDLRWRDNGGF